MKLVKVVQKLTSSHTTFLSMPLRPCFDSHPYLAQIGCYPWNQKESCVWSIKTKSNLMESCHTKANHNSPAMISKVKTHLFVNGMKTMRTKFVS
jgi:hypothetical protein